MTTASPESRLTHKGVAFTVRPGGEPGFYQYQFRIAEQVIEGKVETRLPGMAERRARRAIDRKLREQTGS